MRFGRERLARETEISSVPVSTRVRLGLMLMRWKMMLWKRRCGAKEAELRGLRLSSHSRRRLELSLATAEQPPASALSELRLGAFK